jgi:hypothetical protein
VVMLVLELHRYKVTTLQPTKVCQTWYLTVLSAAVGHR